MWKSEWKVWKAEIANIRNANMGLDLIRKSLRVSDNTYFVAFNYLWVK